ncbi:MAG: HIT domain-containing protein [Planctomycetaceae bacterium]|nr:HIT domain-containing protein [Planctomycetaceae bacterium]
MGKLDVVWAPWRLSYVTAEDGENAAHEPVPRVWDDGDPNCFICRAVVDSDNADRFVVGQSELTIAILNRFPYNNGHLLLAPKRHLPTLNALTPELRAELAEQLNFWVGVLEEILHAEGFNIGLNLGRVAGAGLPGHLHWHIVPRWNGDTNFMAAIGETKVIPQSLQALAEIIRKKA